MPPLPPLEDTHNIVNNSVKDLHQLISIPDVIDVINVPEVVPEVVPDESSNAAEPQVLATTGEDSVTNTEALQVIDHPGTPILVVHDVK